MLDKFNLIKGFFDFIRVINSKRLKQLNYSHSKTKIINEETKNETIEDNTEENKIKDNEMEEAGRQKMGYGRCDEQDEIQKLKTAKSTTPNINIVFCPLPYSPLSSNIFPVYVIQISQLYVLTTI